MFLSSYQLFKNNMIYESQRAAYNSCGYKMIGNLNYATLYLLK
jgi:hypothetical protein